MTTAAMTKTQEPAGLPDMKVSVRQVFGIDSDLEVPAYSEVDPHVPDVDSDYRFDRATTLAILAALPRTAASWSRAITAPANRPISSRSRRG
jgi:cobaltochelatase CobS